MHHVYIFTLDSGYSTLCPNASNSIILTNSSSIHKSIGTHLARLVSVSTSPVTSLRASEPASRVSVSFK